MGCGGSGLCGHGNGNLIVRIVVEEPIVNMANINVSAGNVVVGSCAKPHTVLPKKILSIKGTVCFVCKFVSR